MSGWVRGYAFELDLKRLVEKLKPADSLGESQCRKCGLCCWKYPCSVTETDVNRISEILNITPQEFFQTYLVVDRKPSGLCLVIIRKEWKDIAGKYLPDDNTYDLSTPCFFYDEINKKCTLYPNHPEEGKEFDCSNPKKQSAYEFTTVTEEYCKQLGWSGDRNWQWADSTDDESK